MCVCVCVCMHVCPLWLVSRLSNAPKEITGLVQVSLAMPPRPPLVLWCVMFGAMGSRVMVPTAVVCGCVGVWVRGAVVCGPMVRLGVVSRAVVCGGVMFGAVLCGGVVSRILVCGAEVSRVVVCGVVVWGCGGYGCGIWVCGGHAWGLVSGVVVCGAVAWGGEGAVGVHCSPVESVHEGLGGIINFWDDFLISGKLILSGNF